MRFELWKKIVDELEIFKQEGFIKDEFDLRLYWLGESFLHPQFYDMLSYLFKKDFASYISIATNATHMTEEFTSLILDFTKRNPQVKFYLTFGIDGFSPATIAKIKQVDISEKIYKNIKTMIEERKKINLNNLHLIYQAIVLPENSKEIKQFLYYWKNFLTQMGIQFRQGHQWSYNENNDFIWIKRCDTELSCQEEATVLHKKICASLELIRDNTSDNNLRKIRRKKGAIKNQTILTKSNPCYMAWQMAISWDGRITPCCLDNFLELEIGNLNTQSLKDIYFGQKVTQLRLAHVKKELKKFPFCYRCNSLYLDVFTQWSAEEKIAQLLDSLDKNNLKGIKSFNNKRKLVRNKLSANCLNICLISREYPTETDWGGIGNYTYNLAHGLSNLGCQVHVIAQSLDIDKDYLDGNIHVHRIAHKTIFPFKGKLREFLLRLEYSQAVYKKLKKIIKEFNIQIVETPNFSAEGFIYSLFKKTPLVIRLHTHFSEIIEFSQWVKTPDRRLSSLLEEIAILQSNLITCSTKLHAEIVFKEINLRGKNVEIIPLGVPLPEIKENCNQRDINSPIVLFIGRLEKRKGVHILIKAIPYVLKKIPQATFNIIGRDTFLTKEAISFTGNKDESFQAQLINDIPEQYRKNVNFLGYVERDDLARYYEECDIFVAPSLYESFGLIYIEAMSYAKPVIGCGVGGVSEVIEDGISGILVPPEDYVSLAESILNLINNNALRRNMGEKARERIKNNFSDTIMAERTLAAYKKVL
jgi:hypothetical protein